MKLKIGVANISYTFYSSEVWLECAKMHGLAVPDLDAKPDETEYEEREMTWTFRTVQYDFWYATDKNGKVAGWWRIEDEGKDAEGVLYSVHPGIVRALERHDDLEYGRGKL